jgi:hypothetical protein
MWLTLLVGGLIGWLFCYVYVGMRAPFQSARRKLMVATWSAPSTGEVYGVLEIDFTNAQRYIERVHKETGKVLLALVQFLRAHSRSILPSICSLDMFTFSL